MQGIILAGGRGTRLAPYTTIFPKPLLPIGELPILEVVIRQLALHGIQRLTLAVGYLAEMFMAYCADGRRYGVTLSYARETEPLGTAGPLGSIAGLDETFLVMNGDILTTLDYGQLLVAHRQRGAIATIAAHRRSVYIDFGVIDTPDQRTVAAYIEKPTQQFLVSMGIYIFEPEVLRFIAPGQKLDFPDLVQRLLQANEPVALYPSEDFWLDIGRPDDYAQAIDIFTKQPEMFLRGPATAAS